MAAAKERRPATKVRRVATKESQIWGRVPLRITPTQAISYISKNRITNAYLGAIKSRTNLSDKTISNLYSISEKTLRGLRTRNAVLELGMPMQEQTLFLVALIKHGLQLFGTKEDFTKWLETENFYFNNQQPLTYLNTISGIKFADDRLTAMEYGDNV